MRYTVSVSILLESGERDWVTRYFPEASDAEEAKRLVIDDFKKGFYKDYEIAEIRVSEYQVGDEKRSLCKDAELWELEEYEKNALGKIVRALERISKNGLGYSGMSYSSPSYSSSSNSTPWGMIIVNAISMMLIAIALIAQVLSQ